MTSKQKLLRLRDEVIAERIEQRKDKIRLIEKHNITVVPNNRCIRICMGNTVFDILLLSDEGRAVKSSIVFCTGGCFFLLISNNRRLLIMLILMVVVGFVFMLLYIKKEFLMYDKQKENT